MSAAASTTRKNPLSFLERHGFETYAPGCSRLDRKEFCVDVRLYFGKARIEWLDRVPTDNVMGAALEMRAAAVLDITGESDIEPIIMGMLNHEEIVKMGRGVESPSQDSDAQHQFSSAHG